MWGPTTGIRVAAASLGLPSGLRVPTLAIVWALGLLLLRAPGRTRRFGVGLGASALVVPTLLVWGQFQTSIWPHP